MKKLLYLLSFFVIYGFIFICCESDEHITTQKDDIDIPNITITNKIANENGFNYKIFYQEKESPNTRRGLIILAVGDGSDINDFTLNNQCEALAKKGFVAITTTYRPIPSSYQQWYVNFKEDISKIISKQTTDFKIDKNKVILGGISRGGNLLLGTILPGQMGANNEPFNGIKGVILECAGGDDWKGSAILFPVLFMSNETDNAVGTEANGFKNGLQRNNNPNVKKNSYCMIISGEGHCTNPERYIDFILENIDRWFI